MTRIIWAYLFVTITALASGPYFNIKSDVRVIKALNESNEYGAFYSVELVAPYPKLCGQALKSAVAKAFASKEAIPLLKVNSVVHASIVCGEGGLTPAGKSGSCQCQHWRLNPLEFAVTVDF